MELLDKIDNLFNEDKNIKNYEEPIMHRSGTWLFIEHPLFEDLYYPVQGTLNENEISHFEMLTEMRDLLIEKYLTRTEKKLRKKEFLAAQQSDKGVREKEVKKILKDLTKKSRTAFHELDKIGKKSFIAKYILHGLEQKQTSTEAWGRIKKGSVKELYSDHLKSLAEKKRFVNDVIKAYKEMEAEHKEGEKKIESLMKRFKSLPDLELQISKSTDGQTQKLFNYLQDKFRKGWLNEDAYLEMLFKIRAKQYNSTTELADCVKQWSALDGNTKTGFSIDITTVCPKREELLENMRRWAKAQKDLTDAIEDGANDSIINRLRKREKDLAVTPGGKNDPTCIYCYVESHRQAAANNPKYFLAKAEQRGKAYQDEFVRKWVKTKKGEPETLPDGSYKIKNVKSKETIQAINQQGGLRFFGSGDYVEDKWTDKQIERIIADADRIGLQLKAITKQPSFVKKYAPRLFKVGGPGGRLKGKPAFNINVSVDEQKGFPLHVAQSLKKKYNNIRIRVVATNPDMAASYAANRDVDIITLLHMGGAARERMKNVELFQNMAPGSKGWKVAIEKIKEVTPRSDWNDILSKLCGSTTGCPTCPLACGFNPKRVADFTLLATGKKKGLKKPIPGVSKVRRL